MNKHLKQFLWANAFFIVCFWVPAFLWGPQTMISWAAWFLDEIEWLLGTDRRLLFFWAFIFLGVVPFVWLAFRVVTQTLNLVRRARRLENKPERKLSNSTGV
jgi:hypothetical protein